MHDANVSVGLVQTGDLRAVPAAVGTAAYRIVQESLTNVARHAGGAPATVTVRMDDHRLTIEVCDEGAAVASEPNGTGMGIRGMRERAAATAGTLHAGPRPGGGFLVRAEWSVG